MSWRGGIVGIGPEGLPRASGILKLVDVDKADLFLHPKMFRFYLFINAAATALPAAPAETRAHPDPAAWQALLGLAHRTYAPATEASRRLGAGSGLRDDD